MISRTGPAPGERPVLERQPLHAAELGGVVGDEREDKTMLAIVLGYKALGVRRYWAKSGSIHSARASSSRASAVSL